MAEVDSLTIKIKSSADAASSALDKLIVKLQQLQGIAGNGGINIAVTGMKNLTSATNGATSALTSFLARFATITTLVRVLKAAVTESMNYTETFNYFNVAMKNYTAQAEEYAQRVNSVLGINVEQWENAQATFMSLASSFGIAGEKADVMSTQLTQLTYDLSSLKNVDPTVALQKLRSALAGEIEPMRAWGVDISKAAMKMAALELGITKTYNAMTQAEKAQLRYYIIMKQTTDVQGDMARTLSSPANQFRVLKQAVTECARALGNVFIPILKIIIPLLIGIVNAIKLVLEFIAMLFGFKYPSIQWYGDYTSGVNGLGDAMDKTGRKAKKLKGQLAGFDEINNLTTNKGGGGGVGDLAGAFADFELPTYEFLANVDKMSQALQNLLIPLGAIITLMGIWGAIMTESTPIGWIVTGIALLVAGIINLYNTSETFRTWVQNAWEWFKGVMASAQQGFNNFFGAIFEWLWNAGDAIANWVSSAWVKIKEFWSNIGQFWSNLKAKAANTWKAVLSKTLEVWEGIKTAWRNAPTWFNTVWTNVKTKVADKWKAIKQGAVDAWAKIKEVFGNIPTWFRDKFAAAWKKVKDVFSTGGQVFAGIKEGIENTFKAVVNALISGINKIITTPFQKIKDILTRIKNTDVLGFKPFSFLNVSWSIPQIPKLAQGGIVDNPRLAMIGENGAEAIVPLEHNTEWINKVAAQINDEGNDDVVKAIETLIDVVVNKQLVVDGASLARGISKEINRQTRIMGEGLVY